MSNLSVFSSDVAVLICPPVKDNRPKNIKFNLVTPREDGKQRHVICNGELQSLVWDKNDVDSQDQLFQIQRLIAKRKYDQALKKTYFFIRTLVMKKDDDGNIDGNILVKAFLTLSNILQKQGHWDDALGCAVFASELDPQSAHASQAAAIAFRHSNKPYDALGYSEEAVSVDPDSASARQNLAISYRTINLPKYALEHAEHALFLKPKQASSYITLANVLIDMQKYKEAAEILEEGLGKLQAYEFNKLARFITHGLNYLDPAVTKKHFQLVA